MLKNLHIRSLNIKGVNKQIFQAAEIEPMRQVLPDPSRELKIALLEAKVIALADQRQSLMEIKEK